jgi:hypothetical protein
VSHHNEADLASPCCWVAEVIGGAFPETAGVTLSALAAIQEQETFTARQVAYLMNVMYLVGAQARTAGDRAELTASQGAHFVPAATRAARIAARLKRMAEQHEIEVLRRTGSPPAEPWPGGTSEQAAARYMWGNQVSAR